MLCSRCGGEIPSGRERCPRCAALATGLPREAAQPTIPAPGGTSSPDAETRLAEPATVTHAGGPVAGAATSLRPGQIFGTRYRIIRELGRGGMGVVYQAWDDELSTAVALKVVLGDASGDPKANEERERRFKQELVLARQVTHKHVIRIHDLGEIGGLKYFTMPFVKGETLSAVLRREGRLPVPRALALARQIASGLMAAHEVGIVHRDLKPANIMVGDEGHALILDFGIARSVSGPGAGTASGAVVGTLDYMAPEQLTASRVDQRADVYAFGLILSEMLVGRHATGTAASTLGALTERARQAPPPLRSFDPNIPASLERIVTRCLQPEASARYQTSAELAADLDRLDPDGHPLVDPVRPPLRARWLLPALVSASVLALAAAGWFYAAGRAAPAAREPVSVLVANFDNQAGEPLFEGALEQALGIAVEGASFITASSHVDAERLLAKVAPGATLNEEGARLIARREGIKVVLAGSVARRGSGYSLAVKVMDPAVDRPLATVEAAATGKADVLATVGSLGGRIRTALGDTATGAALAAAAETFTAASLDAVRSYSQAQELALRRKDAEAITLYRQAIAQDPQFGRAYAGWAVSAANIGRKAEAAEAENKALSLMDRMTEREKYRTMGVYFFVNGDYEHAVENYETLVKLYPADTAGHSNLALAYFFLRNFPKALDEGRRALKIMPSSVKFISNNALYAMYAGDFAAAAADGRTCIKLDPSSYIAYLPLAIAELAAGRPDAARAVYEKMAGTDATGASAAANGLADLALYEGRTADARALLLKSVGDDARTKNTAGLISKHLAIADSWLLEGRKAEALAAARMAITFGRDETALVPAARASLAADRVAEAQGFAAELQKQVPTLTRAYGKIIEAEVALKERRTVDAVDALKAARGYADVWLARYDLGVAYVQAGLFAQAILELETCEKRRGEATAIFFDDLPTFRCLAPLQYWLGRAKEGLGMKPAAMAHYKAFIALRPAGLKDPLADDARKRAAAP